MPTIIDTMSANHRHCDDIFASAEELISKGDWEQGEIRFMEFHSSMEHHFSMEEKVLFPDFEERTGQTMGPTQVMRMEHSQMRTLFSDMAAAIKRQNKDEYLGLSETLMMFMQQHNMKEEQMLYPMIDQAFGAEVDQVIEKMNEV